MPACSPRASSASRTEHDMIERYTRPDMGEVWTAEGEDGGLARGRAGRHRCAGPPRVWCPPKRRSSPQSVPENERARFTVEAVNERERITPASPPIDAGAIPHAGRPPEAPRGAAPGTTPRGRHRGAGRGRGRLARGRGISRRIRMEEGDRGAEIGNREGRRPREEGGERRGEPRQHRPRRRRVRRRRRRLDR